MTLTHSEPFHFMEFRHGPMSMVTSETAIVGLLSEENRAQERAVLDEMPTLGGKILSVAETNADITFESGVLELGRGVLLIKILIHPTRNLQIQVLHICPQPRIAKDHFSEQSASIFGHPWQRDGI